MNILIIGKTSYVGSHFESWLKQHGHNLYVLSSRSNEWKTYDYSKIDSIIHVAAIVHQKQKIPWDVYYEVNTLLPVNIARKAKKYGVKQFIFISTMAVYGKDKGLPSGTIITEKTELTPNTYYGISKREAEKQLTELKDNSFSVAIIRPPSVYGKDCPGNYINTFKKIAKSLPVFPLVYTEAHQSFLYIDNLSELIRLVIERKKDGIYTPQDSTQPSTPELLELMASIQGKKLRMSKTLGFLVRGFSKLNIIKKLYGGIQYAPAISESFEGDYQKVGLVEGMKKTLS